MLDFDSFEDELFHIQDMYEDELESRDLARVENAILIPLSAQRKADEILFDC